MIHFKQAQTYNFLFFPLAEKNIGLAEKQEKSSKINKISLKNSFKKTS
jgi:hypothetical protein